MKCGWSSLHSYSGSIARIFNYNHAVPARPLHDFNALWLLYELNALRLLHLALYLQIYCIALLAQQDYWHRCQYGQEYKNLDVLAAHFEVRRIVYVLELMSNLNPYERTKEADDYIWDQELRLSDSEQR